MVYGTRILACSGHVPERSAVILSEAPSSRAKRRHPERSAVILSEAKDLVIATTRSFGPTPWDDGPQDDVRATGLTLLVLRPRRDSWEIVQDGSI